MSLGRSLGISIRTRSGKIRLFWVLLVASVIFTMIYLFFHPISPETQGILGKEVERIELSYHRDDDPSFFPKPKKLRSSVPKKTSRYFGYYMGDNLDLEYGRFIKQFPPLVELEDIDCEEYYMEHRKLAIDKGSIIDIEDRKRRTETVSEMDENMWNSINDEYFDYDYLFSSICEERKFRTEQRNRVKTDVKWKEGDPVIILANTDEWKRIKTHMYVNCSVDYEFVIRDKEKENSSHIRLYSLGSIRTPGPREYENMTYGSVYTDHYRGFYSIESCSQMSYDLYMMAFHNYDYVINFNTMSDIPLYNDWDHEYYFIGENSAEIKKLFDYDLDYKKSYDQLRNETIEQIRKVHRTKSHCCVAFISHCVDNGGFDRSNPSKRAFKRTKNLNWLRPKLVNIIHNRFKVVNLGSCQGDYKMDKRSERRGKLSGLGSKINYMNQYPFAIAFENRMIDAYTGAKLMHALLAKYTIPIYFGDPFIEQKFPPELLKKYKVFIDLSDFNTISDALDYIEYLLKNETAYLEYFEWRFDKAYRFLPRISRYAIHDYFDSVGNNVTPYCRLAELFVAERLRYYPEEEEVKEVYEPKKESRNFLSKIWSFLKGVLHWN